MCDKKYFIEIEHDVCKSRRESRVWDPEGSCWEESPAYFEADMQARIEDVFLCCTVWVIKNGTLVLVNFSA